jgi:hypothetical protein
VDSVNGITTYPTFEQSSDVTTQDMYAEVFSGKYWASISANPGATSVSSLTIQSPRWLILFLGIPIRIELDGGCSSL